MVPISSFAYISLIHITVFANVKFQNSEVNSDSSILNPAFTRSSILVPFLCLLHCLVLYVSPSFQPLLSAAQQYGLFSFLFTMSFSVHLPPAGPPLAADPSPHCWLWHPDPQLTQLHRSMHPCLCCQSLGPRKICQVTGPYPFYPASPFTYVPHLNLVTTVLGCTKSPQNLLEFWCPIPQNVTVSGGTAFKRWLNENEAIRVAPTHLTGILRKKGNWATQWDTRDAHTQSKGHVRSQGKTRPFASQGETKPASPLTLDF